MTHQKIRPHTNTPTARAAIADPIHRSNIRWLCGEIPPRGQPKENACWTEQPLSSASVSRPPTTAPPTRPAVRPDRAGTCEPVATTWLRLLVQAQSYWPIRAVQGRLATIADYSTIAARTGLGWACQHGTTGTTGAARPAAQPSAGGA